jgi:hypothetical protein
VKINSKSRFYLAADGDTDGTADVSGERSEGYSTLDEAVKAITSDLERHGGVSYIYECIPIKRLAALRVTVEDIAPETP